MLPAGMATVALPSGQPIRPGFPGWARQSRWAGVMSNVGVGAWGVTVGTAGVVTGVACGGLVGERAAGAVTVADTAGAGVAIAPVVAVVAGVCVLVGTMPAVAVGVAAAGVFVGCPGARVGLAVADGPTVDVDDGVDVGAATCVSVGVGVSVGGRVGVSLGTVSRRPVASAQRAGCMESTSKMKRMNGNAMTL